MDVADLEPGAILVFWRESPSSWKGQVGFYYGPSHRPGEVPVLGGSQTSPHHGPDEVNISSWPFNRFCLQDGRRSDGQEK